MGSEEQRAPGSGDGLAGGGTDRTETHLCRGKTACHGRKAGSWTVDLTYSTLAGW